MNSFIDSIGKNVKAILAIYWSLFCTILILLMYFGIGKSDTSLQTQIVTGVFGIAMLIIGYFFGSSESSSKKDKVISDMQDKISS